MQSRRKDFDGLWRRPRALYVLGGGWILFMCWFVGSLAGFDKRVPNHHAFTIRSQDVDEYSQHQILLKVSASEHERVFEDFTVEVHTSQEVLPMGDEFYTSDYGENDTSTTIIFNVFKGRPKALAVQLMKALTQKYVTQPDVWVMCFNSPMEAKYRHVVEEVKKKFPDVADKVKYTVSDFNYKFHGRFLLAYMATTKYVLIVDDDKAIDGDTVNDYIKYMRIKKGVWGNNGHRRASTFEGYKSWPTVGYNLSTTDMEEQDYLSGMWFLEQSWLEYFMKERLPSWATSEDMHLSHVMRKYLNLNTYAGRVALGKTLPHKPNEVQATKGSALNLREFIFDHELGRGNKVVSVDAPVKTLVYAETVGDLEDYLAKLDACPSHNSSAAINVGDITAAVVSGPWCDGGKTAAVFRGAKEQDVNGLIAAAEKLCAKTNCEYFSVKPKISHGIKYFNMREGFGQASTGVEIPFQTGASDVMLSLVGILNNLLPQTLFVPDVSSMRWPETDDAKRNRLQIYHRTVLLAVDIHRNSKTNGKVTNDEEKDDWVVTDDFPSRMETLIWQRGSTDDPIQYSS
ncbi:eukaryotic translation initiation factor [Phytophthora cinnamomi]|uniref:eukaryotic translation initiation factor n=1 Tax=Phytophthora cinnamomi TaxID=4785 RepID=UPI00355A2345|nr:eukaryotic translation initiation factor [Phytophthora cinnamomi]